MPDEPPIKAAAPIRFLVLCWIGGSYLIAEYPEAPPRLGPDYENELKKSFEIQQSMRRKILSELAALSDDELRGEFSETGEPLTTKWKTWAVAHLDVINARVRGMSEWYVAAFGQAKLLANYDYWAKAAFLTLDEAFWLSVGLEPLEVFTKKITTNPSPLHRPNLVAEHMRARSELFRREFDRYGQRNQHDPKVFLVWVNRVELDVHSGFRAMLERMVRQSMAVESKPLSVAVLDDTSESGDLVRLDKRERTSMAKLLVTMAIDLYGYDPHAQRSSVPKEIEDIATRLGIPLTNETIRRYLQIGGKYVDKGQDGIATNRLTIGKKES